MTCFSNVTVSSKIFQEILCWGLPSSRLPSRRLPDVMHVTLSPRPSHSFMHTVSDQNWRRERPGNEAMHIRHWYGFGLIPKPAQRVTSHNIFLNILREVWFVDCLCIKTLVWFWSHSQTWCWIATGSNVLTYFHGWSVFSRQWKIDRSGWCTAQCIPLGTWCRISPPPPPRQQPQLE